ncbi:class I SAM-dependent methyltransferase [Myceligenerans salitolerans]|uniref:S-adenosyl-L-methionine-dependent methyltransferase n=1 Tax=Myceligenerans salitolerans TaxID=1230528 RepID=A0ABS3IDV8_9MICO|nr:SAM-dependent methyltransferase [Myceligenerans salitolerans]MBO0611230.1 SAM-dependent methyltransferase [Myceligenerans salitolerans]
MSSQTRLEAVAATARWTAAARARETARDDRLFADPFAQDLAGDDGPGLLFHFHPRYASDLGNPYLPVRTRWFDDVLLRNVGAGMQVVGIGAGLDVRPFRLDWPDDVHVFEVDQPSVFEYKDPIVAAKVEKSAAAGEHQPRCARTTVPTELSAGWERELLRAGFDPERPTFWFAEGVSYYLPEDVARQVLRTVRGLSAPGSMIALDMIGRGIFRLSYMREFLDRLSEANSPWIWGSDDPVAFMRECGWPGASYVEPGDREANFGRWTATSAPAVANVPRMFLLTAEVPG